MNKKKQNKSQEVERGLDDPKAAKTEESKLNPLREVEFASDNPKAAKSEESEQTLFKEELLKVQANLDQFRSDLDQFRSDKETLMTVFGVFASILVFFSFEFQFLRTLYSFEKIVGFSLIMGALLLGFNMALDLLIRIRSDKKISWGHWLFYGFIAVLFVLGGGIASCGNEEVSRKKQIGTVVSAKFEKYREEFDSKIEILASEISQIKVELQSMREMPAKEAVALEQGRRIDI